MAIINCPECDGKLSSTADTCVHCGCRITVCPECNSVVLGDVSVCGECGYRIKKEKEEPKEPVPDIPISELHEEWRNSKVGVATIFNKYEKLYLFIPIIAMFLVIGRTVKLYFNWTSSFYAGNISNYQVAFDGIKTNAMVGLFVLLILWYCVPEIFKFLKYHEISVWIKSKGINTKDLIDKNLSSEIFKLTDKQHDKHKKAIHDFIQAHVYTIDPKRKMRDIIYVALKLAVNFITNYCALNWFLDILNRHMANIFWNYSTQIETGLERIDINYAPLVIYILIGVALPALLELIFNEHRANKKWVKKELPDKEEYYNVLIKNGSALNM